MFKPKLPQQEQGFTLVEVLVAILIATTFTLVALQAIVIAAVFKARAKQYAEATIWIQKDLESVRQQAAVLGSTTLSAAPTTNLLSVSSSTGFQAGYRLQIGTISNSLYTIANTYTSSSTTIPVTPALTPEQILAAPVGTPVSVVTTGSTNTTLCYANAQDKGFGNLLSNDLPAVPSETNNISNPNSGTKTITGATYTLTRTPTVRDVSPYDVLELKHEVKKDNSSPIATMYTEVAPDAAFQCP